MSNDNTSVIQANNRFRLSRTKQCAKCPWKVSTDPYDIPQYCPTLHAVHLAKTIAEPRSLQQTATAMACHHSNGNDQMYCVGWLHHQLGRGNNIPLRLLMMRCENIGDLKIYGPQHERFEDTLPQ